MKKYISLLSILLILPFAVIISCEDPEVEGAPSGARDIDLAGKTFTIAKPESTWLITVSDITGTVTTKTNNYCADGTEQLVFDKKGTFTYTVEYKFNSKFEAQYTTSNTAVKTISFDFSGRYTDANGDKRSYSGYAGQSWTKTEYTGTWRIQEKKSDGFEAVTNSYLMKFATKKTTSLATGKETLGTAPFTFTAYYYPATFASKYDTVDTALSNVEVTATFDDAGEVSKKQTYSINIGSDNSDVEISGIFTDETKK